MNILFILAHLVLLMWAVVNSFNVSSLYYLLSISGLLIWAGYEARDSARGWFIAIVPAVLTFLSFYGYLDGSRADYFDTNFKYLTLNVVLTVVIFFHGYLLPDLKWENERVSADDSFSGFP